MCEDCDFESALDLADELLELLEKLPESASDFVQSVGEKVESIIGWIEANLHVTDAQQTALENMMAGAERWLDR